jgi:hypothetical protein
VSGFSLYLVVEKADLSDSWGAGANKLATGTFAYVFILFGLHRFTTSTATTLGPAAAFP